MPSSLGWIARREALPMLCAATMSAAPEASTTRKRKRMFSNETAMRNKLNRSTAALNWLAGAMRIQLRESREDEKQYADKHMGKGGPTTNIDKKQDTLEEEVSSLRQASRRSAEEELEELRTQMLVLQEKLDTIAEKAAAKPSIADVGTAVAASLSPLIGSVETIAKKLDTLDKAKADRHHMQDFHRAFQRQLLTLSDRVGFPAEGPHEISDFGEDSQSYADSDADSEHYHHHQLHHLRS
eukprot:TRINITY_DN6658_c0_g1_i2.p1 TRINITY_DN6658_c0_g1~~TRINITY_DN6658_c0_g1_i2.p1  ORF type:complete len:277 (-),score=57.60 TRINITY_DN6658_c0_g1_i2:199-918(-)